MSKNNILAVDVGYGNTKAVWGSDKLSEICFKSVAPLTTISQQIFNDATNASLDRIQVGVNGQFYLVGPDAYMAGGSPLLDPDYVQRQEYLALMRGAIYYMLLKKGPAAIKLDGLVLGLPFSSFFKHRSNLLALGKQKHIIPAPPALRSTYGDTIVITVEKVMVLPQPMGSLRAYSQFFSKDEMLQNPDATNLIVDPGYNSFDWLMSKGNKPDLERSGGFQGGVSQILRAVSNAAGMDLGVGFIDPIECENALESGELLANGIKIDFSQYQDIVENASQEAVDNFFNAFDFRRRFDNVILTGGGARYYAAALRRRLPDFEVRVASDSIMMNARGFYLLAQDTLA